MDSSRLVGGAPPTIFLVCYVCHVLYKQFCGKIGQKM